MARLSPRCVALGTAACGRVGTASPEQRWDAEKNPAHWARAALGMGITGGMLSIPTWCPCLAFLVPLTDWGGWVAPMYFCTPSAPAFSALMLRGGKGSLGLGSPRPAPLSSLAQGVGQK